VEVNEPTSVLEDPGRGAALLALLLAGVATAFLLFVSGIWVCGDGICRLDLGTSLRVLVVVAPGLLASCLPVAFSRSPRIASIRLSAAITLAIIALAGLVVAPGLLFLPSAVAMSIAAAHSRGPAGPRRQRTAFVLTVASLVLTLGAGTALLFLATGERCVSRSVTTGRGDIEVSPTTCESTTLLESQGTGVIGILLIPVAIAAFPLLLSATSKVRLARGASAAVLFGFALLGMFSIGLFYVPAALAMVGAASIHTSGHTRTEARTA
jgi:hypothetical protein